MTSMPEIIERHAGEILQLWRQEAEQVAAAKGLSRPELISIMPTFLASLGRSDVEPEAQWTRRQCRLIESHLSARLREGFHLDAILEEFALLGRCITRVWLSNPPAERPGAAEVERLFADLQVAAAVVTEAFTQHMREDEQAEKRYLRRLQAIASKALEARDGSASLRACLKDVLELVMEAMAAQTAAILLCEPESQDLILVASAGIADEPLARYATSQGPVSFAAKTASRAQETTSIADVATTELDVSDELRRSGIHALLGVCLPQQDRLVGVMYVGIREPRSFTAREVRRIEMLGERLTLHLDNARLYAELRQTNDDLCVERAQIEGFVSVLAHDLRGPLSVARLNAQNLLRHPEMFSTHRKLAEGIVRNVDRTDRMVRDLLDAHRIRAGQPLSLELGECDLGAIVRDVVADLAATHGDRFVLQAAAAVRGIWSAADLRRAIWNLATNAIKYGAADTPVTITVTRLREGAAVAVHNEGPPIALEDQAALFKPFAQLRSASPAGRHGWGLGLTLVEGCAAAHGGCIEVVSAAGQGTTFTLRLPADAHPYQPSVRPAG
jgi:signal transduction histidine kinase